MKSLGIAQYYSKVYKFLEITVEWARTLGKLPKSFIMVIIGYRGNGKTEFCVLFAKLLCMFGKAAWLSYESGHGPDLQMSMFRNDMIQNKGQFIPIDPNADRAEGLSYLEELFIFLDKPKSPQFIFIDSLDYTGWNMDDYKAIKKRYPNKAFIFIGHALPSGKPKKAITDQIMFDAQYAIIVKKYVAFVDKSRMGGGDPFIIWDKKAREHHPNLFIS